MSKNTATQIDLPDGRRVWIPPTGRPYWCHEQPCKDLTDEEIRTVIGAGDRGSK
jgi:hypothetical protein